MRAGTTPLTTIRPTLEQDRIPIRDLLSKSGYFRQEEVDIALELIDSFLHDPDQKDYDICTGLDEQGKAVGFVCLGPVPLTVGTFDLYWIAVEASGHRRGVGTALLAYAEGIVRSRGGRLLVAETSSQPSYERARAFYRKHRFLEVARIRDYYTPGDDMVVFGKYFSQSGVE